MTAPTVGYVGLNHHHAEPYLQSLAELPVDVTCVCEPDETFDVTSVEAVAHVPSYDTVTQLLENERPDVLWVSLSNRDTPRVVETAVQHGVDVYTEKPVARTTSELEPLIKTVDASESTVAVSYPWRSHPVSQELQKRNDDGFFGTLRSVDARFVASSLQYRDVDHYLFDRHASGGGIVQWLGIHWIDLLPWLLDDPIVAVSAKTTTTHPETEVEDGAIVQFELASGALGTLQCGYYLRSDRYDTSIKIDGMDGTAAWDPIGDFFGFDDKTTLELESSKSSYRTAPRRFITYDYNPIPGYGGGFGLEFMQQFLTARTSRDVEVPASLQDAMVVLRVLDAVYESAESGEWVTVR
ncbi:Gfo/Idh/MocA family protein [Haloprofundus salinisoli]|uniref:Gfo/Idh/MocA family protein n=1 Tax=Haloprofundus salinisoli TaxID=2876193 RepID=UPI001CCBC482|nr:Gfo/Idh/MocA family oxidoreductase [Haloprofundus salinisoli]